MLHGIHPKCNKAGRSVLYPASVVAAAFAVMLWGAGSAEADSGVSEESTVVFPIIWHPTYVPITAFKATDGLYHLQYQLLLTEVLNTSATIVDSEVLDADTRQTTGHNQATSDDGRDIRLKVWPFAWTHKDKHGFVSTLPAGQAGLMFFFLSFPTIGAIPAHLQHRFITESDDKSRRSGTDAGLTQVSTEQPVVIEPTMSGSGWFDGNGAGPSVYDHRLIFQPANGTAKPDEAYAIDWIKLDGQGHTYSGDPYKCESFFGYGEPILSATDGEVVIAEDGFPNQTPNKPEKPKQLRGLYGNNVIVAIGGGKYAVYAHLKPGSVAVKVGQHVHAGDQLGALGNSGNSDAPHLHFQISDAASVVEGNSLPFVISSMHYRERIKETIAPAVDKMILENYVPEFDHTGASSRKLEMPLQGDVIDFP